MKKDILPFDVVFNTYSERIYRLIFRHLFNKEESEDITQDVFLKAYKKYDSFRNECEVYSWLYRIAINRVNEVIRNKIRKNKKSGVVFSIDSKIKDKDGEEKCLEVSDPVSKTPFEILQKEEIRLEVEKALFLLPKKYRDILILRDIEGLPYEEISRILGVSIDGCGVRLVRARQKLMNLLKKYCKIFD